MERLLKGDRVFAYDALPQMHGTGVCCSCFLPFSCSSLCSSSSLSLACCGACHGGKSTRMGSTRFEGEHKHRIAYWGIASYSGSNLQNGKRGHPQDGISEDTTSTSPLTIVPKVPTTCCKVGECYNPAFLILPLSFHFTLAPFFNSLNSKHAWESIDCVGCVRCRTDRPELSDSFVFPKCQGWCWSEVEAKCQAHLNFDTSARQAEESTHTGKTHLSSLSGNTPRQLFEFSTLITD